MRIAPLFALVLLGFVAPPYAHAYNFGSPLSAACHEEISLDGLAEAGWPVEARVAPLSGALTHITRDLPFDVPGAADDTWTLALVLGARYNDLHGYDATQAVELSRVHGDDGLQREHCLRARGDDGASGDASAIAACRAFMREQIEQALGAAESIDSDVTVPASVTLAFSGRRDVVLPAFPFAVGRALHALQDSFTHAFRTPDGMRIRHVVNFVDSLHASRYDEARDGHTHMSVLDDCSLDTEPARLRRRAATDATRELLAALRDNDRGRAGRLERVDAVLDTYLAIEPGCTAENAWCGADEPLEKLTCSASPSGPSEGSRSALVLFVLAVIAIAMRRSRAAAAAVVVSAALLLTPTVRADGPPEEPLIQQVEKDWSVLASVSLSLDRGGFAERLGGRYRVSRIVEIGLDVEHNPWYSLQTLSVIPGAFNAYATLVIHWARFDRFELRSSVSLGVSVLLNDLVASPSGSVGPFGGISLLGFAYAIDESLRFFVDPADVVLPIPSTRGVPLLYHQYRITAGFQWAF
jgi:hypothetical protein